MTYLASHRYFVSGVSVSRDASHLLTSSWDGTFRLWDHGALTTKRVFLSRNKDVLDVTISPYNCRIMTVAKVISINISNLLGKYKAKLAG